VGGAIALNLSPYHTFRDIIIPQAIPPVVPALGNYLVALFKETPLLSAIAVLELMQTAKIIGSQTFRYTEPITWSAVLPGLQPRRGRPHPRSRTPPRPEISRDERHDGE
jgi:ABC-type amino acid transport system permease subunit